MDHNYVHLSILLDRSGSMATIAADMIGGFNNFIADQKKVPGKFTVTVAQFDNSYDLLQDMVEIGSVKELTSETFSPRGSTALFDSLYKLISNTGQALARMDEKDRPGKVMFLVITDGQENCSREITRHALREKINEQTDKYKWSFTYLGSDESTFAEGTSIGANSVKFRKGGQQAKASYAALASNMRYNRSSASGQSVASISQDDLDKAGAND